MAKYIDNNSKITFNNVSDIGTSLNYTPVSKKNNYTFNDDETAITTVNSKVLNAVDIDWNAADLQSAVSQASTNTSEDLSITGINTTGDLIKVVAEQQAQIKSLSLLVKALYESIVVTDSEITPDS